MIADPAPSPTFVRWPYVFNLSTASFDPNHHSLLGHCFLAVVAVVFPTGSFLRTRTLPSSPTHLGIHHMPLVCSSGILFLRCSHLPTQTPSALSSIQISLAFPFISTAFFILLFFLFPTHLSFPVFFVSLCPYASLCFSRFLLRVSLFFFASFVSFVFSIYLSLFALSVSPSPPPLFLNLRNGPHGRSKPDG